MKILYIADERDAAAVAAGALHAAASNVTLAWAQTPASSLQWLQANRDAAAVIVEAVVQGQSCAAFVEQVRRLGLTTPVVVVAAAAQLERALAAANAGADGYVLAGPSLRADLPRIVAGAIEREHSRRVVPAQKLTELAAARDQAVQRLERAEEARQQTEQRSASELAAAAARLADVQGQHQASLAREARISTALQQRLLELESALRKADERRASDAVAFADQLTKRHTEFTTSLTDTARSRDALASQLTAATSALDEFQQSRRADAAAAAEILRRREAELGAALAEAVAEGKTLEGALAEAQAAHRDAQQRAELDLAAANERQAALEDLLAQEGDRARSLEQRLADAETARQDADHRHIAELAAAAAREADAVEQLTRESAARAALERDLAGMRTESARGRRRSLHVVSAYRRRNRELKTQLEARLTGERTDADRRLGAKDEEIRQILQERERLRDLVGTTQEQLQRLHGTIDEERQAYARARETSESELQRVAAEYGQLRQTFDQLQAAFQALEHVAGEHAAERARLESVVAERDGQLSTQAERHLLAEQVAHDALAQLQETLRQTLEASGSDIARLQREIDALRRELDAARTHADALRGVAVRVPDLEAQLDLSEKERRRQFERAPCGLCRCTPAGVITDANHAFAALLGRRHADQLRNMDFAAAVFDRAGDVGWVFERTRAMRKAEPVETRWKTQDGRDLIVRLQALATTTGSIDIVVEDITGLRALEERLRRAQRMEAVGRLASEVAVTCDTLLRDVARDAHEWLPTIASDDAARRRGERLVAELARAAGFLRGLTVYGDSQVRALEPVSVQRVLRDLAPVLQGLVGDQIGLVLPKSSGSFDVDVDAERLERILVNMAGYARERMPLAGDVKIELATAEVGRSFVAKYPHVRPGPHVLITVTELPGVNGPPSSAERGSPSSDKPGVDLGALVDLIGTCGGHLWVEAKPAGSLLVKIHLPKPASVDATDTRGPGAPADRRGWLARLLRATSAAVVRS